MDNIYFQSEISRTFLKDFNYFIDKEYNSLKINIKNIILEEINNEQLKKSTNPANYEKINKSLNTNTDK
jgi:hypothetical protein